MRRRQIWRRRVHPVHQPATRPLAFAIAAMRGVVLNRDSSSSAVNFRGAAFDSRRVEHEQIFFALPGGQVDGYDYCVEAQARGASAVVVDVRRGAPAHVTIPAIGVDQTLTALADLASAVRAEFPGRVVAITGSNGKTTTKELCAAALSAATSMPDVDVADGAVEVEPQAQAQAQVQAQAAVWRTQANYNTEVGLPLTILSATGREAYWVLEMAMRGRHQIAALTAIARPHVGVITNVAGAHLELLGSLEEVARAKGELFAGLGPDGIAVLPAGDPLVEAQAAHIPEARKLRFGEDARLDQATSDSGGKAPKPSTTSTSTTSAPAKAAVAILDSVAHGPAGQTIHFRVGDETIVAHLPLVGAHNARNAAAALAVAHALGVPAHAAADALSRARLPAHRSSIHRAAGRIVVDDCYNANPASMRAALTMLIASAPSQRENRAGAFALLGDMLELGPETAALHRQIGREVGAALAGLGVVGDLAAHMAAGAAEVGMDTTRIVAAHDDPVQVAATVASWTQPGDWILVKASRGMHLEKAVDSLLKNLGTEEI